MVTASRRCGTRRRGRALGTSDPSDSLSASDDVWTGEQGFNAVPLILAILFGWIPSVILLIAMRLGLEFAVATVRTAQNTKRIADATEAGR